MKKIVYGLHKIKLYQESLITNPNAHDHYLKVINDREYFKYCRLLLSNSRNDRLQAIHDLYCYLCGILDTLNSLDSISNLALECNDFTEELYWVERFMKNTNNDLKLLPHEILIDYFRSRAEMTITPDVFEDYKTLIFTNLNENCFNPDKFILYESCYSAVRRLQ